MLETSRIDVCTYGLMMEFQIFVRAYRFVYKVLMYALEH